MGRKRIIRLNHRRSILMFPMQHEKNGWMANRQRKFGLAMGVYGGGKKMTARMNTGARYGGDARPWKVDATSLTQIGCCDGRRWCDTISPDRHVPSNGIGGKRSFLEIHIGWMRLRASHFFPRRPTLNPSSWWSWPWRRTVNVFCVRLVAQFRLSFIVLSVKNKWWSRTAKNWDSVIPCCEVLLEISNEEVIVASVSNQFW